MSEQSANSQDSARYGWEPPTPTTTAISIGAPEIRSTRKEVCPECGERLHGRTDSCEACGANLLQAHKPIRCMHCHTTASSELVVCPGCGRELRAAQPKFLTYGAPALLALLLVAVLVTQWERISPIAWARTNLVRGVVLVEDISASLEPEMVIVMTPIVEEASAVAAAASVAVAAPVESAIVSDTQALAVAVAPESIVTPSPAVNGSESAPATAAVAAESPVGVGGPEHLAALAEASEAVANAPESEGETTVAAETLLTATPTVTDTPLPTDTPLVPTATEVATSAKSGAAPASSDAPTLTPTPTWTMQATPISDATSEGSSLVLASTPEKESVGGMAQMAALSANGTTLPTPTTTPTVVVTPLPTPTATPVVYQVRAGDTLVTIAASYGVAVEELMAANEISAQDVYVIQPGQMIFIPVETPEPVAATGSDSTTNRVSAPDLLVPPDGATVGCATGGTLMWDRVQFVKDSDKYLLHLGFVSGRSADGAESITWVLAQSGPVTQTEWQLDTTLCELAPTDYDQQWRWWVEVVEDTGGGVLSVSPPSEIHGFVWQ